MPTTDEMPRPAPGDVILFSTDCANFSNPTIGWVTDCRGERTANVLAFSNGTFVYRTAVHHRDEPELQIQPGWQENGCWEFAPVTKSLHKLLSNVNRATAGK